MCLRSTVNYPHVIAARVPVQLTDVTCGGAETSDYFSSQYQGVAPQLDAVQKNTQLVTMTIGGNDSGVFIDSIVECGAAGLSTAGQGSPCKDKYGSSFEDTIKKTTYPSLVKALKAVRAKAPKARVAILGYPWILPASGGCFPQMPVATGDVPYLRHEQATLNDAVRRAAAATGSHLRRPQHGLERPRRLPGAGRAVGRARRGRDEPGDRPPERAGGVAHGRSGVEDAAPALTPERSRRPSRP